MTSDTQRSAIVWVWPNEPHGELVCAREGELRLTSAEPYIPLAEAEAMEAAAYEAALYLARTLHKIHYSHVPQWEPLDDTVGVITQIDNMVAGIVADTAAALEAAKAEAYRQGMLRAAEIAEDYGKPAVDPWAWPDEIAAAVRAEAETETPAQS